MPFVSRSKSRRKVKRIRNLSVENVAKVFDSNIWLINPTESNLFIRNARLNRRLLQISSFNDKMDPLNEVGKLITGISYYPNRHGSLDNDTDEWLTSERMAVSVNIIRAYE